MMNRSVSFAVVLSLVLVLGACGSRGISTNPQGRSTIAPHGVAETSSPWQTGFGIRGNVRAVDATPGSLYVLGSYQRQWFDGGHDNILSIGLQGRRVVTEGGTFIGPELTYNNWRVNDGIFNQTEDVFGAGLIVGHPIGDKLNVWSTVGLLRFGDVEQDGTLIAESATGFQFNLGVELVDLFGGN